MYCFSFLDISLIWYTHTASHCPPRGRLRCLQCLRRQRVARDDASNCLCASLHLIFFPSTPMDWDYCDWQVWPMVATHTDVHPRLHCGYCNFPMNMSCSHRYGNSDGLDLPWHEWDVMFYLLSCHQCFLHQCSRACYSSCLRTSFGY